MSLNILNSNKKIINSINKKSSRKAKILPQFSISSENKPLLDLLEIQRKSFFDFLQYGIPDELAKTAVFRETAKNSTCKQELELKFNPETYKFISPTFTPKEAILNGKTYACKVYVQATLLIRSPYNTQKATARGVEPGLLKRQSNDFLTSSKLSFGSTLVRSKEGVKKSIDSLASQGVADQALGTFASNVRSSSFGQDVSLLLPLQSKDSKEGRQSRTLSIITSNTDSSQLRKNKVNRSVKALLASQLCNPSKAKGLGIDIRNQGLASLARIELTRNGEFINRHLIQKSQSIASPSKTKILAKHAFSFAAAPVILQNKFIEYLSGAPQKDLLLRKLGFSSFCHRKASGLLSYANFVLRKREMTVFSSFASFVLLGETVQSSALLKGSRAKPVTSNVLPKDSSSLASQGQDVNHLSSLPSKALPNELKDRGITRLTLYEALLSLRNKKGEPFSAKQKEWTNELNQSYRVENCGLVKLVAKTHLRQCWMPLSKTLLSKNKRLCFQRMPFSKSELPTAPPCESKLTSASNVRSSSLASQGQDVSPLLPKDSNGGAQAPYKKMLAKEENGRKLREETNLQKKIKLRASQGLATTLFKLETPNKLGVINGVDSFASLGSVFDSLSSASQVERIKKQRKSLAVKALSQLFFPKEYKASPYSFRTFHLLQSKGLHPVISSMLAKNSIDFVNKSFQLRKNELNELNKVNEYLYNVKNTRTRFPSETKDAEQEETVSVSSKPSATMLGSRLNFASQGTQAEKHRDPLAKHRVEEGVQLVKQNILLGSKKLVVDKKKGDLSDIQVFRPWIFLGELPLMTKRGHFILNGSPRVIVNQFARCPGFYFQEKRRGVGIEQEIRVSADLIPQRGPWLRIQSDWEGRFWARLKQEGRVKYATLYEAFQEFEKDYNPPLICLLSNSYPANTSNLSTSNPFLGAGVKIKTSTSSLFSKSENATFQERKIKEDRQKKALIRLFKNPARYSLGKLGRSRVNERIHYSLPSNPTTNTTSLNYVDNSLTNRKSVLEIMYASCPYPSEVSFSFANILSLLPKDSSSLLSLRSKVNVLPLQSTDSSSFGQDVSKGRDVIPSETNASVKKSEEVNKAVKGISLLASQLHKPSGFFETLSPSEAQEYRYNGKYGKLFSSASSANKALRHSFTEELMAKDLDATHTCLERLLEGQGFTDDIDNLKNRFIRTSGKLLQQQFELGLFRLNEVIMPLLGNLLPSEGKASDSSINKVNRAVKDQLPTNISSFPNEIKDVKQGIDSQGRAKQDVTRYSEFERMFNSPSEVKDCFANILSLRSSSFGRDAIPCFAKDAKQEGGIARLVRLPFLVKQRTQTLLKVLPVMVQSQALYRSMRSCDSTNNKEIKLRKSNKRKEPNALRYTSNQLLTSKAELRTEESKANSKRSCDAGISSAKQSIYPITRNLSASFLRTQSKKGEPFIPSETNLSVDAKQKAELRTNVRSSSLASQGQDVSKVLIPLEKKPYTFRFVRSKASLSLSFIYPLGNNAYEIKQGLIPYFPRTRFATKSFLPLRAFTSVRQRSKDLDKSYQSVAEKLYGSTNYVDLAKLRGNTKFPHWQIKKLERENFMYPTKLKELSFQYSKGLAKQAREFFAIQSHNQEQHGFASTERFVSIGGAVRSSALLKGSANRKALFPKDRLGHPQYKEEKEEVSVIKNAPFRWLRTSKPINSAFREFFGSNPLSQYMDQTNPLAEITHKRRLSSMGPGGIKRETAGMEVRGIHPTHYGRVCPIETPEGKNAGLVNSPTVYGRVGNYGFLETPLYEVIENQVQTKRWAFFSAQHEEKEKSSLATCDTGLLQFNFLAHLPIPVQTANNPLTHFQQVERYRVGYRSLSPIQTISIATALIPFLEHDDANRALMGSNMQRQAIPLLSPERPIVGTGFEPLVVIESGQALQATKLGCVFQADANSIIVHTRSLDQKPFASASFISLGQQIFSLLGKGYPRGVSEADVNFANIFDVNERKLTSCPKEMLPLLRKKGKLTSFPSEAKDTPEGSAKQMLPLLRVLCEARKEGKQSLRTQIKENVLRNFRFTALPWSKALVRRFGTKDIAGSENLAFSNPSFAKQGGALGSSALLKGSLLKDVSVYRVCMGKPPSCFASTERFVSLGITSRPLLTSCPKEELSVLCKGSTLTLLRKDSKEELSFGSKDKMLAKQAIQPVTYSNGFLRNRKSTPQPVMQAPSKSKGLASLELLLKGHPSLTSKMLAKQYPCALLTSFPRKEKATPEGSAKQMLPLLRVLCEARKEEVRGLSQEQQEYTDLSVSSCSANIFDVNEGKPFANIFDVNEGKLGHISSAHNTFLLQPLKQDLQFYERSNQETCLNQRPLVQEGDWIQKGDFLADSSASHSGDLALGKNVTVAYMPWEGYNFEDAIVISDRLVSEDIYTSLHIERYDIKVSKNSQGKERITNRVPGTSNSLKHLDNFGIARISSWVQPGDILVGKVVELKRPLSPYERLAWELASRLSPKSPEREKWLNKVWLEDISLRLPSGVCGRVINSQIISTEYASAQTSYPKEELRTLTKEDLPKEQAIYPQEVHIYLAIKRKIQIGDKLAGRHGNKGIVSAILPQEDMPYLGDGSCIDMVLNPLGVPSRMNLGQIFECLLGLAGSQLGCNFRITPFDEIAGGEASRSLVFLKLYQCRLMYKQQWLFTPTFPGKSKLFDGRTGEPFENWVTVGQAYMLKLIHMVDHKIHARSTGPYSLFTRQPVRGRSRRGGQRLGEMEVWAVEGFGAAYTLQEFLTIKSDDLKARTALQKGFYKQNDVTFGKIHIAPGNPEAFKVLISELQALCLHIQM